MKVDKLVRLGLAKNEAIVYRAILSKTPVAASEIIKYTGFHRNIVYDNLEKLVTKGLLVVNHEGTTRIYAPTRATAIQDFLAKQEADLVEKKEVAKELAKELSSIRRSKKLQSTSYQGKLAVRELIQEILNHKEYYAIGVSNASVEVLGKVFWKNFIANVKEKKIKEHLLLNSDFKNTVGIKSPRSTEVRVLSELNESMTETLIFGNNVAILVFTNPPVATLIESKDAATSFLNHFQMLWKQAK